MKHFGSYVGTALGMLLLGCQAAPPAQPDPGMWLHYREAKEVQVALVAGDMGSVRAAAQLIAHEQIPGLPAGSGRFLDSLRTFASHVASAPSITQAAAPAAHLARMCGDCHRNFSIRASFPAPESPPARMGRQLNDEMQRHVWGTDRLWEGLAAPSNDRWTEGAHAFVNAGLAAEAFAGGEEQMVMMRQLERRVHELGQRGVVAGSPGERAELFAELTTTCVSCHENVRRTQ